MNISPREIVKSNNDEANHLNFLKKKKKKRKRNAFLNLAIFSRVSKSFSKLHEILIIILITTITPDYHDNSADKT